ncbi:MAG TPA: polysaccharide biosynthesis/export family protein [Planctomycetota bacterium]|nr:polysaccharide biosynthesis/export family protein [Planctomycetota bacterium]
MRYNIIPALLLLAACESPAPEIRQPRIVQPFVPPASETAAPAPKTGPRPDPLLIPGDILKITVFRQPDLDLEVRILDNGTFTYPLLGEVKAVGRTAAALEQGLKAGLQKDYLENPSVTVTVREFAKRKVFIVGGVAKPDGYEISPDARLTVFQLVASAGGFTDRAFKEYVQVVRRQGAAEKIVIRLSLVDVERRLARGEAGADLELWPDDLVMVPSAARIAYVMGAVQNPRAIEVPVNARMTVSMAVANAGSYTKFASTGSVMVLRHTPYGDVSRKTVNLDSILEGRVDLDLEVEPGDVVYVPERGIF